MSSVHNRETSRSFRKVFSDWVLGLGSAKSRLAHSYTERESWLRSRWQGPVEDQPADRIAPVFDRSYYELQYRNYQRQNPRRKLSFYRRLADSAAGSIPNPRILDFGCAFGLFLAELESRWQRFGVDASAYAIQRARNEVPGAAFAVSQTSHIPFQGCFDLITAFDVLEHIPDVRKTLRLISQSLVSGGKLVFVVPVYDGPTGPIIRALDKDPTHVHKQARSFWLDLAATEFQLIDWWGIYRYLVPGGVYFHFVTHSLRGFTPAIACLAQRK